MKASVRGQSSRPSTGYKAGSAATHPRLSIYDQPPDFEISIDEFEEAALDRLYVLKYLEVLRARNATPDETASKLEETLRSKGLWIPRRDGEKSPGKNTYTHELPRPTVSMRKGDVT